MYSQSIFLIFSLWEHTTMFLECPLIKILSESVIWLFLGETIDNVADTFKQRLLQEEDKEKQVS